ncbi:MAG: DNA mismatch repair protein MutL, partial [Lachnospiraceae bacterium]|nr:DNA mismatch repair protein MutL [Lachnospiraceae bacterium]
GEMFATYWIVECDGCAYMIDQHAAHEKILYEKFMENVGKEKSTQLLSPPIIISLSSQEEAAAEKYRDVLKDNGFVLEHFGGHEYALSEIPLNLYGIEPKNMLLELLDELIKDIKGNVIKGIKEKIATCACKAAVKGNTEMTETEAKELIKQLLAAENPFNCPHGRPIIIDLTKKEIEKKFKRIV